MTLDATAGVVSDYRFRGVSRSGRDPAVQGSLYAGYDGWFAGGFASSVANRRGAHAEVDLSAGWSGEAGPVTATAGVIGSLFPGGRATDYVEVFGSVAKTIGPLEISAGANYAPDQAHVAGDNVYVYGAARAGIPATPLTIRASVGFEQGGLVADALPGLRRSKLDYMAGIEWKWTLLTLGLQYIGTDVQRGASLSRQAADTAVVSLTARF